jgi:5-oxoprolinase (ATP-hydrolysing)
VLILIDRGGTFTDCLAIRAQDGTRTVVKLPSEGPGGEDAAVEGVRRLCGSAPGAAINLAEAGVREVRLGTTVATNALLTGSGAQTLLVTNRGFADLPIIGEQHRPDLFALDIVRPAPLCEAVVEVDGRVGADGRRLGEIDRPALRDALRRFRDAGGEAVAVALIHADRFPDDERLIAEIAAETGFDAVSPGHRASPLPRLLDRMETALVDAYLTPVLQRYVRAFVRGIGADRPDAPRVRFMTSSGGLVEAAAFTGKDAVFSGPAGGVIGLQRVATLCAEPRAIGWDMGGTSTDVSHVDAPAPGAVPEPELAEAVAVADRRIRVPSLRVESVAAGGGSLLKWELGRLQVGPESAGALPGPACYGRGGPAALTDANLILGRIQPRHAPSVFGPGGDAPLDDEAARAALTALAARIRADGGGDRPLDRLCRNFVRIADETMAKPIKTLSVAQGRDVRRYSLVSFGGAGGQHAASIARLLGIRRVIVHPLASIQSAYGLAFAPIQRLAEAPVEQPLTTAGLSTALAAGERLAAAGRAECAAEGAAATTTEITLRLLAPGVDTPLPIALPGSSPPPAPAWLIERFAAAHRARFGFVPRAPVPTIASVAVRVFDSSEPPPEPRIADVSGEPTPADTVPAAVDDEPIGPTPVFLRDSLPPCRPIPGPALIVEPHSTVVVPADFTAERDAAGIIRLSRRPD